MTDEPHYTHVVHENTVNGLVQVCSFLMADQDITAYANPSFSRDYRGFKFNLDRGCILAIGNQINLMRPVVLEGGKVSFSHQEIKVDLDKLNKIERKEKHNIFRRILHAIGIRIPNKYPSNEARERNQEALKGDSQYQATMKTAEKNFITAYNQYSLKTREKEKESERKAQLEGNNNAVAKNKFLNAFPEITNAIPDSDLDALNQSIYNDTEKVRLTTIIEDLKEDEEYEFSFAIDEEDLEVSKEFEPNVK